MGVLLIGHDGMLGRAVAAELASRGISPQTAEIAWGTPAALGQLRSAFDRLAATEEPWTIFWCAGAGVVATPQPVFDEEEATFTALCRHIARGTTAGRGTFFFASSAGGVYAGSAAVAEPPFDEFTPPRPLAPYGHAKRRLEAVVAETLGTAGVRVAIGRIANLYGPGQDLSKPQGLISQLCLGAKARRPTQVYVPLDTLRDYIFVSDAARLVVDFTARVAAQTDDGDGRAPAQVVKVLASGRASSVGQVVGSLRRVLGSRPPVVAAASPQAALQSRDLRLTSRIWPDLDRHQQTTLPAGISACLADVGRQVAAGRAARK